MLAAWICWRRWQPASPVAPAGNCAAADNSGSPQANAVQRGHARDTPFGGPEKARNESLCRKRRARFHASFLTASDAGRPCASGLLRLFLTAARRHSPE